MVAKTPAERSAIAKIAAHSLHARIADPAAHTARARTAFLDSFARKVDPAGTMDPAQRERLAEHERKAHFQRMALKSAQARRRAKESRQNAADLAQRASEAIAQAHRNEVDADQIDARLADAERSP